ncbi:FecR family protein [Nostoc sp. NIES-3756]|uniref:FecR family protein n=1 Tax=Nostoc sp. NIES-3756 TaxID=1751286 RepID=UPI001E2FB052|nr:FecR family protein [Nostoc sp. NIES-3756]
MILVSSPQVNANTPLTRAEIQSLRNFVQLVLRNSQNKRPAKPADAIIPGDGLATGRASLADLRFNDGSLARIGEQAVFQFMPRTRNFRLSNGTVLLLIPPGRGQTRIQTPSATAAIRGSALFVRYDQKTDTTIVGALTNSGIAVSNKNASQTQPLQAGQLLVIVKGQFQGLYDFDLQNFYETSELTEGLDLTRQNPSATVDPAIASVQAEIIAALATQSPVTGQGVIENPAFLDITTTSPIITTEESEQVNSIPDDSLVNSLIETGEILFQNAQKPMPDIGSASNNPSNNPTVTPIPTNTNPGNENPVGNAGENPGNGNNLGGNSAGNPGNDKPVGNAGENPGNGNNSGGNSAGNPGNDKPVGNAGENPGNGNNSGGNSAGNPGNDKPVGNAGENPGNGNQGSNQNQGNDNQGSNQGGNGGSGSDNQGGNEGSGDNEVPPGP